MLGFNEPDNTGTPATQANTTGQAWFKDDMAKVAQALLDHRARGLSQIA
ncbi:MAG: hypothetical protein WDO69_27235 [Pseudomonadota bacterium]